MTLIFAHTQWMFRELWRQPTYVVSTVCFPALFYMIFAIPESKDHASANLLLASFSGFAVFGVFFLQLGVSLAQERTRTWYSYLKLLPVHAWQLFLSRLFTAMIFALIAVILLWTLGAWQTDAYLTLNQFFHFSVAMFAGAVLFCLMGIAHGIWCAERTALPLGNLIYLPLSFAGGLWKPPEVLPESIRTLSEFLPTRFFGEALWSAVRGEWAAASAWWGMLAYGLVFALWAYVGYRREAVRSRV